MRMLVGRTNPTSVLESVGLARANFAIPNSLPAFYFEVRFLRDESFKGSIEAQLIADESDDEIETPDDHTQAPVKGDSGAEEAPVLPFADPAAGGELPSSSLGDQPELGTEINGRVPATVEGRKQKQKAEKEVSPKGLNVGVGLYREGIPLQGAPGEHNSYAYVVPSPSFCSLRLSHVSTEVISS
jgi:hypothetical protein